MYIGVDFSGKARFYFCNHSYKVKIAEDQWNQYVARKFSI
jgi:hypothetical protein